MKYCYTLLLILISFPTMLFGQEMVFIRLSTEGKVINFETASVNGNFNLDVDYYSCDPYTNIAKAGKVSKIGAIKFDYYPQDNFSNQAKAGKLSRIGNISIDYFPQNTFTDVAKWGKISKIKGTDQRVDLVIDYTDIPSLSNRWSTKRNNNRTN